MSNIKAIPFEAVTGKLKYLYESIIEKRGKLVTVDSIQRLNPDSIEAHVELYVTGMFSHSPL
jgi:hypothetical protein